MKHVYTWVAAGLVAIGAMGVLAAPQALAAPLTACEVSPDSSLCADERANKTDYRAVIKNIVNILLYIIGAVAVIMVIVGGLRYVISAGNQQAVAGAKNTIVYSAVGLLVAVLAYAIVNWAFAQITAPAQPTPPSGTAGTPAP